MRLAPLLLLALVGCAKLPALSGPTQRVQAPQAQALPLSWLAVVRAGGDVRPWETAPGEGILCAGPEGRVPELTKAEARPLAKALKKGRLGLNIVELRGEDVRYSLESTDDLGGTLRATLEQTRTSNPRCTGTPWTPPLLIVQSADQPARPLADTVALAREVGFSHVAVWVEGGEQPWRGSRAATGPSLLLDGEAILVEASAPMDPEQVDNARVVTSPDSPVGPALERIGGLEVGALAVKDELEATSWTAVQPDVLQVVPVVRALPLGTITSAPEASTGLAGATADLRGRMGILPLQAMVTGPLPINDIVPRMDKLDVSACAEGLDVSEQPYLAIEFTISPFGRLDEVRQATDAAEACLTEQVKTIAFPRRKPGTPQIVRWFWALDETRVRVLPPAGIQVDTTPVQDFDKQLMEGLKGLQGR